MIPAPELGKPDEAYDWVDDKEFYQWLFNKTETERMKMAESEESWNKEVTKFKQEYGFLLKAITEEQRMKDQRRNQVTMITKGYGQSCTFNYECETDCCLEYSVRGKGGRRGGDDGPRGRGGDGPRGRDGDGPRGNNRDLRRLLQGQKFDPFDVDQMQQANRQFIQDGRFGGKVCTRESRCDDDISETIYTVWNFFAGLLIGGLCICVFLQYRFHNMSRAQVGDLRVATDGIQMGQPQPSELMDQSALEPQGATASAQNQYGALDVTDTPAKQNQP